MEYNPEESLENTMNTHCLGWFTKRSNITTQGFERLATSQLLSATRCDAKSCRVTAEAKSGANPSLGFQWRW